MVFTNFFVSKWDWLCYTIIYQIMPFKATPHNCDCGTLRKIFVINTLTIFAIHQGFRQIRAYF